MTASKQRPAKRCVYTIGYTVASHRCLLHSKPGWCHDMKTFSALLALCEGNPPVTGGFPSQKISKVGFDFAFVVKLNSSMSKQSWGWWFETPRRSCDVIVMLSCFPHLACAFHASVAIIFDRCLVRRDWIVVMVTFKQIRIRNKCIGVCQISLTTVKSVI